MPTRPAGTVTGCGPSETAMAIVDPSRAVPVGVQEMTWPFGTVASYWLVHWATRPTAWRAVVAPVQVEPVSDGMFSVGGPPDTVTAMVENSMAWPVGVHEITVPDFTVVEFRWVQVDFKLAAVSAAWAAGQSPVMAAREGMATDGGPVE